MRYFIGWDVGTWKCTAGNEKSCDALVVMNEDGMRGHYRGNLSASIAAVLQSSPECKACDLIKTWFGHCGLIETYSTDDEYYVAIDTPLGWPRGFVDLLRGRFPANWSFGIADHDINNRLLFRRTERTLNAGFSVVTHSIGNQSAKGMSLICGLGAREQAWGTWRKDNITLIETYPKACLRSESFIDWITQQRADYDIREWYNPVNKATRKRTRTLTVQDDTFDAGVCAFLAKAFATQAVALVGPPTEDPENEKTEGWIFYPSGDLVPTELADKYSVVTNAEGIGSFGEAVRAFQAQVSNKKREQAAAITARQSSPKATERHSPPQAED